MRLIAWMAIPGPIPISRTGSCRSTCGSEIARTFRLRFEDREATTPPPADPQNPLGCPK
jgi:hypothetical protein